MSLAEVDSVNQQQGLNALADRMEGRLIRAGDSDYDSARRVWNGMIDRKPAAIAECKNTGDVVAALTCAREEGIPVSVRCGGHGVSGNAVVEDGLMVDLSPMNRVAVDPAAKLARVQGGAKLGDFDRAAQAHGLATTAGVDPGTGVGGLTLGGGTGFLARKLGLAIDNLVGAEVVLADGSVVKASESDHPDLLWALKGGGGNFGIVTEFKFRLSHIGPDVLTAQVFYPFDAARDVAQAYRDFMRNAPDDVGADLFFLPVPAGEPFPEDLHGSTTVAIVACYTGKPEDAEEVLRPLTDVAEPLMRAVQPMPYLELQSTFKDAAPDGERYYWKSHFLDDIEEGLIDLLIERAQSLPGPYCNVFFEAQGGAIGRVPVDATAFPHRRAAFNIGISSGWSDPHQDGSIIEWTRSFHDSVAPFSTGGVYSNYMDFDEDERVRAAYGANLDRLKEVKARYDPENLFRMNQNISPAASGTHER